MTLDKSRPFSEVFGEVEDGHRYSQDGKRFDVNGDELDAVIEVPTEDTEVKRRGRPRKEVE